MGNTYKRLKYWKFNPFNLRVLNYLFGRRILHVERTWKTHKELIEYAKMYRPKCYIVTPPGFLLNEKWRRLWFPEGMSEKQFESILNKTYLKLKEYSEIELHVHFPLESPTIESAERVPKQLKKELIVSSKYYMEDYLKITPKEIVFGGYISDNYSDRLAEKLGMKVIGPHFHWYDWKLKEREHVWKKGTNKMFK